jgi:uncharacterized protein (DUF58 family)
MRGILPFLIVLIAVAFFTKVDVFFYLLYTLFGIYVLGRLWARRSLGAVSLERHYDQRVFLGQTFTIDVEVRNRSWLPVLWLRLSDTVPTDLTAGAAFRQVVSLLPRERLNLSYTLTGRRRGYYQIGPFGTVGGDLLGTATYQAQRTDQDFVIVYPKIVALRDLGFPSQSPFGILPSRDRIFEDPTRIQGVREYQPGDSLRRMDWKTSARVGTLQVRRYEPAISLETAIFLNLDAAAYPRRERYMATELGIVIAASVAVHVVEKRQAVSLATNGRDPLQSRASLSGADESGRKGEPVSAPALPLRKGREHLINLLDLLARIEVAPEEEALPFLDLLGRKSLALPWGSTIVVITSREIEGLLDTLMTLRRRGLVVILVLTSPDRGFAFTAKRADRVGVQALRIWSEQALDVWR